MRRDSLRICAVALPALLLAACTSTTRAKPKPPPAEAPARAAAPTPTPKTRASSLSEEGVAVSPAPAIVEEQTELEAQRDEPEVTAKLSAAPDPQVLLASIGPSTPPQRAASLRLTAEGRRLQQQGDSAGALDRFERAVKVDPSNPHGYYGLAEIHQQRGRPDQALAFADKSIVLFAAGDRTWLAQVYTFRAGVLERAGRFREARDSYRNAVKAEPGNVAARAGLARLGEPSGPSTP